MTEDQRFEIEYGYWYNLACERLYRRIDVACNLVQLVGGSAAAAAALGGNSALVVASGLMLALAAAISLTVQPAVKCERHMRSKCQYLGVKRLSGADAQAIGDAIINAQASGPAGFGALAMPAYNAAARALGSVHGVQTLRWWERLADFVA